MIETDRRDELRIVIEGPVDFLEDALRFDRHVVEIRFAQHRAFAFAHLRGPFAAIGDLTLAHFGDECFERETRIGDDADLRTEYAADLRRLDIDVHEGAIAAIHIDGSGLTIGPAVADAEHEVALEKRGVSIACQGLQAHHAGVERMIVG